MKNTFTCCFFFLSTLIFAQNKPVFLHIKQLMNQEPFALNTVTDLPASKVGHFTRLQYYISTISVVHDGGQKLLLTDLHFLVNAAKDSVFALGELPVANVEGIQFSIGVEKAFNHLDVATYPNGHPLGAQSPDMQWGWAAGYRFVALEGDADGANGPLNDHFEVHALGDNNYFSQEVLTAGQSDIDGVHLRIKANYVNLLDGIDVTNGVVAHSLTGKAVILLKNMQTKVFSADESVGICCNITRGQFVMFPNPSTQEVAISYDFFDAKTAGINYRVFDEKGQLLTTSFLKEKSGNLLLQLNGQIGVYFVEFATQNGQILQTQRLLKI